jgi:hypothetical protein
VGAVKGKQLVKVRTELGTSECRMVPLHNNVHLKGLCTTELEDCWADVEEDVGHCQSGRSL